MKTYPELTESLVPYWTQCKFLYVIEISMKHYHIPLTQMVNLVPRIVSEPLFQSLSRKTTLAQGMELSNLIG